MNIINSFRKYFDPTEPTKQLQGGTLDMCGIIGFTVVAVAGVGYKFFNTAPLVAKMAAGVGGFFIASYITGKSGYVIALGLISASGLLLSTIEAIRAGRFFVHLEIDIARIIDVMRRPS